MLNKKVLISLILPLMAVLTIACSSTSSNEDTDKEKGKENEESPKVAEITLDNVEYGLPSAYDNAPEDQLVLRIDISIKNNGKEPLGVGNNHFVLYQGETMVSTATPEDYNQQLNYSSLNEGKQIKGSLFYLVDKGEMYELVYTSEEKFDPELEEVKQETIEIEIDGNDSKLLATTEKLDDPAKALSAYIDILFYGIDNPDFEKLTGDSKELNIQEYNDTLLDSFISTSLIPEEDVEKESFFNYVSAINQALKDKVPAVTVTKSISGDEALVELTATPIDFSKIESGLEDKITQFVVDYPDTTEQDLQEFVFDTMAEEVKKLEPESKEITVEIQMMKVEENQWQVDPDDYRVNDINKPFLTDFHY